MCSSSTTADTVAARVDHRGRTSSTRTRSGHGNTWWRSERSSRLTSSSMDTRSAEPLRSILHITTKLWLLGVLRFLHHELVKELFLLQPGRYVFFRNIADVFADQGFDF